MFTIGKAWFGETIFFQPNSITVRKLKSQIYSMMLEFNRQREKLLFYDSTDTHTRSMK